MTYEAAKIIDLGQIAEHVFQPVGSPLDLNEEPGTAGTVNQGFVGDVATSGSSGGLAGLGLIGGLFAALGRRSNQAVGNETPGDEPERDRANER